ncbi:uncharacterized protein LOC110095315 isoform X3 [Dendrobium catenatum]|uniref:uncharacterized protein LOC110095315 isoform X3 n=1 Tax=Dendrobium catenatum TaxID=906689 RepID=UPI0010A01541|nr:uncharacterized protein LOC110095315 isoform X3 [Dendrobium catenatum]
MSSMQFCNVSMIGKWASSNNALLSFQQPAFGEGGGHLIPSIQSEVTSRALAFDDSSRMHRWMNGYTLKDRIRNEHICEKVGVAPVEAYMPHVSLIYGDLSDEEKERARKRAEEIDESVCGLTFEVSSLALCKTDTLDKTTESWEMVELCDLTKKDFA